MIPFIATFFLKFKNSNWNNKANAHAEISLVHRGLKILFTFKMEIGEEIFFFSIRRQIILKDILGIYKKVKKLAEKLSNIIVSISFCGGVIWMIVSSHR